MTQDESILLWLREGSSINPIQALSQLGVFRLAACIHRLRKSGYLINSTRIRKQGLRRMVNFSEYRLNSDPS